MTNATYQNFTSRGAELYQSFFVPAIATPVSGELLAVANLASGERVVDVACGTGVLTRAAAERVGATGRVTGVDVAFDMLEVARATPAGGAPIEWHQADAAAIGLPDGTFDVATCQMGLMFMDDKPGAIAELHRLLAPGGRVFLNTPGPIQPLFAAMEKAIADHIDPALGAFVSAVFSMPDPAVLAAMLHDAGFVATGAKEYVARFALPGPIEFLWNYINLTPMGPIVAAASGVARAAMERELVEAWRPHLVGGGIPMDQPMALAWGRRA